MGNRREFGRLAMVYGGVAMLVFALFALERTGPSPVGSLAEQTIEIGDPIGSQREGGTASAAKFCDDGDDHNRCANAPLSGSISDDCPAGTTLIAKFEWNGSSYVFEQPEGNEGQVTVTGTATGGTWSSTVPISAVVLKGANDLKVINYSPSAISGSFDNSGLLTPSGQTADISNIRFCA